MPACATDTSAPACGRCAESSTTCCRLEPGQEEFCFPVSGQERAAMLAAGAKPDALCSQENTPGFVDNLCRLFPGEEQALRALFPKGDRHDRLAVARDGACMLLGPGGCILPRDARPYYCRLFPFWVSGGQQLYFEFENCQALRESNGGAGLLSRLGMRRADVFDLYQRLRQAWGLSG